MARPSLCAHALGLIASLALPGIAAAAPPPPEDLSEFPSAETLRKVQVAAMICARDNSTATCGVSRSLADGLLDHPMLSASCKDDLWSIRQRSVVVSANTFGRRESLSKLADNMAAICKRQGRALVSPTDKPASDKPKGFNFGFN